MTTTVKALVMMATLASVFAAASPPAPAQQPAPAGTPELAGSIAGIQRDLARLVDLFEEIRNYQRVDLMLKRIELKERRIAPMESKLRSAENGVEGLADEIREMEQMRDHLDKAVQQEALRGADTPGSDSREMLEDVTNHLKILQTRLEEQEFKVRAVEDRLAADREEIDDLDAALAELLE